MKWDVHIGPDSKEVICCDGYDVEAQGSPGWTRVGTLPCLGCKIDSDGRIVSDFDTAKTG